MASFYSNNYKGRQLRLDVWQDGGDCKWTLYSSGGAVPFYTIYNLFIGCQQNQRSMSLWKQLNYLVIVH